MTQTCKAYNHAENSSTQAGCPYCRDDVNSPETMKSLLKTLFPVAWKADRGRQDPELMAAYVSVQRILGLTKEEIEEME